MRTINRRVITAREWARETSTTNDEAGRWKSDWQTSRRTEKRNRKNNFVIAAKHEIRNQIAITPLKLMRKINYVERIELNHTGKLKICAWNTQWIQTNKNRKQINFSFACLVDILCLFFCSLFQQKLFFRCFDTHATSIDKYVYRRSTCEIFGRDTPRVLKPSKRKVFFSLTRLSFNCITFAKMISYFNS